MRRLLRQILLDLRLAGVTHLPRSVLAPPQPGGTLRAEETAARGPDLNRPDLSVAVSPPKERCRRATEPSPLTAASKAALAEAAKGSLSSVPDIRDSTTAPAPPLGAGVPGGAQAGAAETPPAVSFTMLTLPAWAQEDGAEPLSPEEKRRRLEALARRVAECRRCAELVRNRTQTVFADGNPDSALVFVGEAPGAEEDRQGLPFVGRAGQLLTDIITKGMGLRREDVYICNVIKCRPPENRTPTATEVANCREFLDEQLALIRPRFICCLGSVAAQRILGGKQSMTRLRGQVFTVGRVKVVCTYHPAYLLRNPEAKRETWEDIKLLMKEMGLTPPPPRRGGR